MYRICYYRFQENKSLFKKIRTFFKFLQVLRVFSSCAQSQKRDDTFSRFKATESGIASNAIIRNLGVDQVSKGQGEYENVVWLQIAVDDQVTMQKRHAFCYLK